MPSLSFIIDSGILVVTDSMKIPASQLETFSLSIIDTASYARERDILQNVSAMSTYMASFKHKYFGQKYQY